MRKYRLIYTLKSSNSKITFVQKEIVANQKKKEEISNEE